MLIEFLGLFAFDMENIVDEIFVLLLLLSQN